MADPLLRSGDSQMLTVAVTSVLGFAFWIAAARLFPSQQVGRGSVLVSAMILVSVVCELNLSSVIVRFLPITKLNLRRAILYAYITTAVISVAGGVAFIILAPIAAAEYRFLYQEPSLTLVFVLATVIWGVFSIQDSVLIAIRRAPWVPIENGLFGIMKICALPLLLLAGITQPVFVAWVLPMAMLVVPVNYLIFRRFTVSHPFEHAELSPVERFGRRGLGRFMAQDYVASILIQASTTLVPLLVLGLLGSSQGAYFYIPFTIVGAFDLLFVKISISFTVEAAMATEQLAALMRKTVTRFGYFLVAGIITLLAGASVILLPFGPAYLHAGASVLRLLACASLFRAGIALYCAVCRVEGRAFRILLVQAATLALTISLTYVFAQQSGLDGVGVAWLLANLLVACAVWPSVYRLVRRGGDSAQPGPHTNSQPR
jgi:O-antigen/teichoic acid export membrane protein